MPLDYLIFVQLNGLALRHLWLDVIFIFLAKYLPYILIGVLFLFLLANFRKYWPMVAAAFSAGVLGWVITKIIRFFYFYPRPFVSEEINLLFNHAPTGSFPSAHATIFFAISAVVYFYNRKAGIAFLVASFLIGLARIFCGVHWPSDILGGIGLGILSGILVHNVFRRNLLKGKEVAGK